MLWSHQVSWLLLTALEITAKLFSAENIHETVDCLFRSSWMQELVPFCLPRSSISLFAMSVWLKGENFSEQSPSWSESREVFCRLNVSKYLLRRSGSSRERTSRSIWTVEQRSALRFESLNGKLWTNCLSTMSLALLRVAEDSFARPWTLGEKCWEFAH